MGLTVYDEAVKETGALNKVGSLARVTIKMCSYCGLDYTTDQCVEVSKERTKFVADLFNIPDGKVVHTSSINQLALINTVKLIKTSVLSPLNSPGNKFTDVPLPERSSGLTGRGKPLSALPTKTLVT